MEQHNINPADMTPEQLRKAIKAIIARRNQPKRIVVSKLVMKFGSDAESRPLLLTAKIIPEN